MVSAGSTVDALNLLQNISPPDLIIIGGTFPVLSISDFMRILKTDERFERIPYIILKNSHVNVDVSLLRNEIALENLLST